MSLVFNTREISGSVEAAFGENASSLSSNTWSHRYPVLNATVTLEQSRDSDGSLQARRDDSRPGYLGVRSATLEFEVYWCGHNTATTGSLTETWLQDLLSDGLGGGATNQAGTTVSAATSATSITFTSTTGWAAGEICRIGAKGDGRCDGQAGVLATVGTPCTFRTAFPGTPDAGDVIYAAQVAHPTDSNPTVTRRFLVGWSETGQQYHLVGCQLSGLRFNLPLGGLPTITFTYRAAYWGRQQTSFPAVSSLENCNTQPIAGGSIFLQDVGTTTRAVISPSEMTLDLDMQLSEKPGPAASNAAYQNINGWELLRCVPTVTFTIPWSSSYDTGFNTDGSGHTLAHILATLSTGDGSRSGGFYLPNAYRVGNFPATVESAGKSYMQLMYRGRDGTDTTSELSRSVIRFFAG